MSAIGGGHHLTCDHRVAVQDAVMQAGLFGVLVEQTQWPVLPVINRAGWLGGWASWPLNFDPIWIRSCGLRDLKTTSEKAAA